MAGVDRRKAAQDLVNAWARTDQSIVKVYAFHLRDVPDNQPSGFLILSGSSPPVERIEPFGFRATLEVPFPTRIAEAPSEGFEARKAESL